MNFIQKYAEKRRKIRIFKELLKRQEETIWGLEMAQEICNAEIKTAEVKKTELEGKVRDIKDLIKERYGENNNIASLKLVYDACRKAQIIGGNPHDIKAAEEKLVKAKELVKFAITDIDIDILIKELEGLFMAETELLTIPKRIQGQEQNIQDQISAIGRNLKTIELMKSQIKQI